MKDREGITQLMLDSTVTMWVLIGFYAIIVVQSVIERRWHRAAYFVGAIVISLSVLGMSREGG